jgi:hypothetical protein
MGGLGQGVQLATELRQRAARARPDRAAPVRAPAHSQPEEGAARAARDEGACRHGTRAEGDDDRRRRRDDGEHCQHEARHHAHRGDRAADRGLAAGHLGGCRLIAAVLLGAGVASLLAVVFTLAKARDAGAPGRGLLTALAIASVALAWLSVHTVFLLRYARIYYTPPDGGIDFGGEPPDSGDFAYLALTIGMTFQVSDTDLTAKRVRRVALHHALLSYLFGP